ncbi:MAG: hypothetical protein AAF772_14985 [Acidobacteriota bacterium]
MNVTLASIVDLMLISDKDFRPLLRDLDPNSVERSPFAHLAAAEVRQAPDPVALAVADLARMAQGEVVPCVTPGQCHALAEMTAALRAPMKRSGAEKFAKLVAETANAHGTARSHEAIAVTDYAIRGLKVHPMLKQQASGLFRSHVFHAHAWLRRATTGGRYTKFVGAHLHQAREIGQREFTDQAIFEQVESSCDAVEKHYGTAIARLRVWQSGSARIPNLHRAAVAEQIARYALLAGNARLAEQSAATAAVFATNSSLQLKGFLRDLRFHRLHAGILRRTSPRYVDSDETLYSIGPHSADYQHGLNLMLIASRTSNDEWRIACLSRAADRFLKAEQIKEAQAALQQLPRTLTRRDPMGVAVVDLPDGQTKPANDPVPLVTDSDADEDTDEVQ